MTAAAALPGCFVGAWRRVSIALGDTGPHEPSDVLWLQAGSGFFADVRLPRGRDVDPMAFAGVATWDAPALTWRHSLDLAPGPPDVGVVEWRGDELVERGVAYVGGEPTTYEEVWRREPGGLSPVLVLTCDGLDGRSRGALVRIGDHAIVMALTEHGLAARRDQRAGAAWQTVGEIGSAALPAIPEPRPDWEPGREARLAPVGSAEREPARPVPAWCVRELVW
jgi:Protein HRI1